VAASMAFNLSRRFLALPAWVWLLFPPLLVLLAYLLGRPSDLSEPGDRAELLPVTLVAPDGDSFRFVPWEGHQNVTPLWSLAPRITAITEVKWSMGWGGETTFGFWKRSGKWRYDLEADRFDETRKSNEPLSLPASDVERLRTLVIEEVNQSSPTEHRGDRLAQVLDHGIERSSYLCVQNAVILLAWLSLPIALLSIVSMFIKPQKRAV
jgi:hypothetical protein